MIEVLNSKYLYIYIQTTSPLGMDLWFVCAFGYAISSPSAIFATGLQWLASAI